MRQVILGLLRHGQCQVRERIGVLSLEQREKAEALLEPRRLRVGRLRALEERLRLVAPAHAEKQVALIHVGGSVGQRLKDRRGAERAAADRHRIALLAPAGDVPAQILFERLLAHPGRIGQRASRRVAGRKPLEESVERGAMPAAIAQHQIVHERPRLRVIDVLLLFVVERRTAIDRDERRQRQPALAAQQAQMAVDGMPDFDVPIVGLECRRELGEPLLEPQRPHGRPQRADRLRRITSPRVMLCAQRPHS